MKTTEANKIDAIRELIVGKEMADIQNQFSTIEHKFTTILDKSSSHLTKEIKEGIKSLDAKIIDLKADLKKANENLEQLSKDKIDKKDLSVLFMEIAQKLQ